MTVTRLRLSWLLLLPFVVALCSCRSQEQRFSGQRAFDQVKVQCDFGPRPVGSDADRKTSDYIGQTLERNGWVVEYQEFVYRGLKVRNVIGKKGRGPIILLGAHFDTRPVADQDPTDRSQPVMGANDGGSGTAVLLELSRILDASATDRVQVWLAFFDAEDRGELGGWPWCVGSQHMAETMPERPQYVVVVDMVGDDDQRIFYEWSGTLWLQERVWQIAAEKGYGQHFVAQHKYSILDDHTSFLQWGIPAADVIDFDYPYWHTRYDTLDKISVDSLQRVGDVLETLLEGDPLFAHPNASPAPTTRP